MQGARQKRIAITILSLCLAGICLGLFLFDPASTSWMPQCPFLKATGWQCPGCGTLRATHAMLHLNFSEALRYNAALPAFAAIGIGSMMAVRIKAYHTLKCIYIGLAIGTLAWWIVRNI